MGHVFLSYAREDRRLVEKLANILEQAGHEVWWDRHIDSGEEFAAEIEAELAQSDVVLVVWSSVSVKSRWVRDEAAIGGDTGRLVPVSIDGVLPPMGFRQFHSMDLKGWRGSKRDERTAELLHSVERRLKANGGEYAFDKAAPKAVPASKFLKRGHVAAIAAALVLGIAAAGILIYLSGRDRSLASGPTLALLPFTAASSDPALHDLAVQARDSVAHAFSDSGVAVKLVETSGTSDPKVDADYLLSAEVSGEPDKIMAIVRMEDADQHITVWTRQIEADRKHAEDLPDRVGAQVAGSLSWAGTIRNLDPRNPHLTAQLLQIDITRDPLQNYQNAARVASEAPRSGMAQLSLAMYTAFALDALPRDQRPSAVIAGRQAADRAKTLIPKFGDVYIPGCVLYPSVEMARCEDELRAALKADPDAPFVNNFLAYLLNTVGRKQEAFDRASLSYQHDPYMPAKISLMVRMFEEANDSGDADALYLEGVRWWPDWGLFRPRVAGILERGDFDALRKVELEPGAGTYGQMHPNSLALAAAVRARSVSQVKRTCADAKAHFYAFPCMLAFVKIGDMDSAFALADTLYPNELGRTAAESERLWLDNPDPPQLEWITSPAAAPMRRDPRFFSIAQRTGLLDYWRSGRPPDFCVKQPEPVCTQLLKRR